MKKRLLGKTNIKVSEISLGCWQLGGKWGDPFDKDLALETLRAATTSEIDCFDTADVYQDGLSENIIGEYLKTVKEKPFVITKIGRKLNPHESAGYNELNIRKFIDDSRNNMNVESLDMVLLHCPPTDVYYYPEVFELLDKIKAEGKIKHYGVSVERIEEGLKALNYPGVEAIEMIFNMFRLRPAELFFEQAKKHNVGVIVRVPLASGLLSGKFTTDTKFKKDDHRFFNRNGEAFDKGETFSGVDFNKGLQAVSELKNVFKNESLPQIALRWILMFDAVSTVIPGASKVSHIIDNATSSNLPALTDAQMESVEEIYNRLIKKTVHQLW